MRIGIDVGALCGINSGNYIFTENLVKALIRKDKQNDYILYSFCKIKKGLNLNKNFIYKNLQPKYLWTKGSLKFEQITNPTDIFLGLNQAYPKSSSKKIIFSHGLSFIYFKELYHQNSKRLKDQMNNMLKTAQLIVVSSSKVKKEFEKVLGTSKNIKVINYGIPFDFLTTKKVKKEKYFLNVGNNHPIKNIPILIDYFNNFREQVDNSYRLYIVTDKKYKVINNKAILQMTNVKRTRLRELYSHASGYLTTSKYESFNFPVLESLTQNTPVVALKGSFIPEMKPYINIAKGKDSFIYKMKKILASNKKIDIKRLKNDFSWNKYVEELLKMY